MSPCPRSHKPNHIPSASLDSAPVPKQSASNRKTHSQTPRRLKRSLLDCTDSTQVPKLKPGDKSKQLPNFSIIPPHLTKIVINKEDSSANLLVKFTSEIKRIRNRPEVMTIDDDSSYGDDELYNAPVSAEESGNEEVMTEPSTNEVEAFYSILISLWSAANKNKIPGSPLIFCNSSDTSSWEEQQQMHIQCQSLTALIPPNLHDQRFTNYKETCNSYQTQ